MALRRFLIDDLKNEKLAEYCKKQNKTVSEVLIEYVDRLLMNGDGHTDGHMAMDENNHGHASMAIEKSDGHTDGHTDGHGDIDMAIAIRKLPKKKVINFDPLTGYPVSQ